MSVLPTTTQYFPVRYQNGNTTQYYKYYDGKMQMPVMIGVESNFGECKVSCVLYIVFCPAYAAWAANLYFMYIYAHPQNYPNSDNSCQLHAHGIVWSCYLKM